MAGEVNKMIKQNLHTHSLYCDGKNTLEEMVQEALKRNFTSLGFSSHGFTPNDDVGMTLQSTVLYRNEVNALKEKYKDQLEIFLGIEQDMLYRVCDPQDYDFIIGSKHYARLSGVENGIDCSKETTISILERFYHNDFLEYAKEYYEDIQNMATWNEVDIIGHLDLIMKFNEDEFFLSFSNPKYINMACDTIDCLIAANKIMEVNTGAIARGYRSMPYPDYHLLQYISEKQGKIILSSDCHNKDYLDCGFDLALQLIHKAGFKTMEVLTSDGFQTKSLNLFK